MSYLNISTAINRTGAALATHGFTSLMRRLSAAGFKSPFAQTALLPDWWEPSCADDASLIPDLEIRIARFLGAPLDVVRDPDAPLASPTYAGVQLRRVRDLDRDRLASAIHAALQIAGAVVRNMQDVPVRLPPVDPMEWRKQIHRKGSILQLNDLLADLWARGIPVVQIATLPTPGFQGLVAYVEKRPVVIVGHDLDEPSRLAFVIAHEVAHVVLGDCTPEQPVVEEDEVVADDREIERQADAYARSVLTEDADIPRLQPIDFKDLALKALEQEKKLSIDAASIIWSWARRFGDYPLAMMAIKALYRNKGGKRLVRQYFDQSVNTIDAPDSDRALLRCLQG
jgi:Zn-dependent peptidase ImmA (M78 family)